ncbi:E3 ubiquitin-protein ligase Kcmf1 isoform X5 [Hyposmocoma kahamanoa]|uniref:E3 ubiquitin-protein ligase Kcmf1 isoform X5 n=1 Tax=Hyposmocoma kahamanoa TaxID=1477025 RepID=UPI000E6D8848|nr:E3 ubiquitin-protein ligase Kcmf1 isoform X5 [Hyposmocoma kahamanoa]
MNRHEGVSCDSCLKNNFRGRRYKCLICIDYDLCAACYESGATTNQHTTEHPMQCILSRSDFDLYYGGEALALEQPQAYTCPFCNRMGFTDTALIEHVTAEHADTTLAFNLFQVVCPVCASMPGGEPNFVTDDFAGHLTLEHRTGPRDLISFLDEPSGIRHGGVRRMPHSNRGVSRARRTNMQFSTGGGISSLSPSSRDAVVDPPAPQPAQQPPPPQETTESQFLLSGFLGTGSTSAPDSAEAESRAALLRGLMLASLGRPAPQTRAPPPAPRAPPQPAPQPEQPLTATAPPAAAQPLPRAKPQPRTKEAAARAHAAARQLPEGR